MKILAIRKGAILFLCLILLTGCTKDIFNKSSFDDDLKSKGGIHIVYGIGKSEIEEPTYKDFETSTDVINCRLTNLGIKSKRVYLDKTKSQISIDIIADNSWKMDELIEIIEILGVRGNFILRDNSSKDDFVFESSGNSKIENSRDNSEIYIQFSNKDEKLIESIADKYIGQKLKLYFGDTFISDIVVENKNINGLIKLNTSLKDDQIARINCITSNRILPFELMPKNVQPIQGNN